MSTNKAEVLSSSTIRTEAHLGERDHAIGVKALVAFSVLSYALS